MYTMYMYNVYIHVQIQYMYSRGQKKVNTSFPCNEEFRFVLFPFYHDGILKSSVFIPIFRFAFFRA